MSLVACLEVVKLNPNFIAIVGGETVLIMLLDDPRSIYFPSTGFIHVNWCDDKSQLTCFDAAYLEQTCLECENFSVCFDN